jgi:hypothetical protein
MNNHPEAVMSTFAPRLVYWAPRVLGLLTTAFVALFALDAFTGRSFREGLPGFVVHLIPAFVLLALVVVSWRYERVGAAVFFLLALGYALMVNWRLDWVAAISGPLVVVGLLFLVSWSQHRASGSTEHRSMG